jgi:hypothetical protein
MALMSFSLGTARLYVFVDDDTIADVNPHGQGWFLLNEALGLKTGRRFPKNERAFARQRNPFSFPS